MPAVKDLGKQMLQAVKRGDAATVRALLAKDPALVRLSDTEGSTPLHHAAWKGHAAVAELLLKKGADVNAKNQNRHWGTTPLHAAAHGNQKAVAEVLLAHGADLSAVNLNGRTPLAETGVHNARTVARLLEAHGASR